MIFLIDLDECAFNAHDCDPHASCYNLIGSFGCTCVDKGYSGDGKNCSGRKRTFTWHSAIA